MKKIIILTTMIMLLGVTGCNKTEANVAKTEMETVTSYEESVDSIVESTEDIYDALYVTEEEFELERLELLTYIEEEYVKYGINENCKNELIELVNSLEYDETSMYGFDVEYFDKGLISIAIKYNEIPEEYVGMSVDEIYELENGF